MPAAAETLLAIPNVSEGRDPEAIAAIGAAFTSTGARLLDTHSDPDHHRTVYTLAGGVGELAPALVAGALACRDWIDLRMARGSHPHVGALDVAPVVHLDAARRGAACAEALVAGEELGARPPLVAFNVELAPPATIDDARRIAAAIRDGGDEGLPGVRALGLELPARDGIAQVSTNVEDHAAVPLATLVAAVARHAEIAGCELVGLAPAAAFDGFPADVPIRNRRTIEEALGRLSS